MTTATVSAVSATSPVASAMAFGWLYPGELRVFDLAQLDTAKAWIAE